MDTKKLKNMKTIKYIICAVFAIVVIGLSANAQEGCGATQTLAIVSATASSIWGAGATTLSGSTYDITGTLTIDAAITFDNCNLRMGPSGKIIMTTNTLLTASLHITDFTHVFNCTAQT